MGLGAADGLVGMWEYAGSSEEEVVDQGSVVTYDTEAVWCLNSDPRLTTVTLAGMGDSRGKVQDNCLDMRYARFGRGAWAMPQTKRVLEIKPPKGPRRDPQSCKTPRFLQQDWDMEVMDVDELAKPVCRDQDEQQTMMIRFASVDGIWIQIRMQSV